MGMEHGVDSIGGVSVRFLDDSRDLRPEQLRGFCEGWSKPLSEDELLRVIKGSTHVVLAQDAVGGHVIGFITAVSDGTFAAYIPLLEVLPLFRGQGIGTQLVNRMLEKLRDYRMVDLMCDTNLVGFYQRFSLRRMGGMGLRR